MHQAHSLIPMDWHLCGRDPVCNFCWEFTAGGGHPSVLGQTIASTSKRYDGGGGMGKNTSACASLIKRGACQNRNFRCYGAG